MTAPEFGGIYEYLWKQAQRVHPEYAVDQVSLMDAAVRLYIYERSVFEKRLKEEEQG